MKQILEFAFGVTLTACSLTCSILVCTDTRIEWDAPKVVIIGGTCVLGLISGGYFIYQAIKDRNQIRL